ncbi:hypothetical protein BC832DRAFT_165471 [Gaertneriomyces semiglobifer]|nr:hypothetical protein BC832DRAFT_165471 [Gaertneriomyces semiglobifer]
MSAPVVYNPMLFSSPQVSQWIQWAKSQDTSGSLHGTQAYPVQTYFPIAGIPYPIGLSPNLQQQSMPALQQPVGVPTTLSAAHSAPAMPALTNAPPTVQFPQEKSPQSPMEVDSPLASPSIELSFDESLDALLNSERKLKDEEQVPKLVKLAMNFTGWPERLRILSVLNATTDKTILGVFMQKQGLKIVHKILLQAKDAISDADAIECANTGLRVLTQLPVDLQDLKDVKTGKLVKFFTTIEGDERLEPARQTAKELMTAWKSLIPKKEEDQRKRDTVENKRPRDTAESEESQAKKPKSDPGSSKRADFEKKKVQAVDNFDIFKTLSHSALPKIKKAEKAVSKPTVATQNLPQENDITEPSTTASPQSASEVEAVPTTASSMLIDDGSVRSYRTSGGDRSASPDSAEDNKPKKKRVRFKDDSELVQIKYFESEPAEYDGEESLRTPHVIGDARDLDRQEGHMAFKPPTDATIDWETPSLISWPQSFEWGKESTEARIQEERERGVVMATYYSDDQIPPSPAEPAEEPVAQMEQLKIIPLDVPAQPVSVMNYALCLAVRGPC